MILKKADVEELRKIWETTKFRGELLTTKVRWFVGDNEVSPDEEVTFCNLAQDLVVSKADNSKWLVAERSRDQVTDSSEELPTDSVTFSSRMIQFYHIHNSTRMFVKCQQPILFSKNIFLRVGPTKESMYSL